MAAEPVTVHFARIDYEGDLVTGNVPGTKTAKIVRHERSSLSGWSTQMTVDVFDRDHSTPERALAAVRKRLTYVLASAERDADKARRQLAAIDRGGKH